MEAQRDLAIAQQEIERLREKISNLYLELNHFKEITTIRPESTPHKRIKTPESKRPDSKRPK